MAESDNALAVRDEVDTKPFTYHYFERSISCRAIIRDLETVSKIVRRSKKKMKTCAFTGHRPQNLPFGFDEDEAL